MTEQGQQVRVRAAGEEGDLVRVRGRVRGMIGAVTEQGQQLRVRAAGEEGDLAMQVG